LPFPEHAIAWWKQAMPLLEIETQFTMLINNLACKGIQETPDGHEWVFGLDTIYEPSLTKEGIECIQGYLRKQLKTNALHVNVQVEPHSLATASQIQAHWMAAERSRAIENFESHPLSKALGQHFDVQLNTDEFKVTQVRQAVAASDSASEALDA
jgi:hypothetical protein